MAVRVRKLAKELNRSPAEIIGVLHAVGLTRYRSADDMLPTQAEERVRHGVRRGVTPLHVELLDRPDDLAEMARGAATGGDDMMARLVPGVVRAGASAPAPRAAAVERPAPPRPPGATGLGAPPPPAGRPVPAVRTLAQRPAEHRPAPVVEEPPRAMAWDGSRGISLDAELRTIAAERAAIDSHRRGLDSERAILAAEQQALELDRQRYEAQLRAMDGERAALDALSAALEVERAALAAERDALTTQVSRARAAGGIALVDLLEERGLRGLDEQERAIGALAQSRVLRDTLWSLRVEQPDALRKLLTERLVLVDGPPPESVARAHATVSVAAERAEVPAAAALQRLLAQLGERLLLAGLRRFVVVGGKAVWHRLLKDHLDPRVELRSQVARSRDAAQAAGDLERADLVLLWGVDVSPAAHAVYTAARAEVIEVDDCGLAELVAAVVSRL